MAYMHVRYLSHLFVHACSLLERVFLFLFLLEPLFLSIPIYSYLFFKKEHLLF
jgi:hypothetical protein